MLSGIASDLFKRFGAEIIKWLLIILAVAALIIGLKSCNPWNYEHRLEKAVEEQNQTIKDLVKNNQDETKAVDNEREERKETTQDLVAHLDKKAEDKAEIKDIITDAHKQYIPPPKKPVVKKAKAPVVKKDVPTVSAVQTVEEEDDLEVLEEAKRTQHNLRVAHEAIQKAYEKALQMSEART